MIKNQQLLHNQSLPNYKYLYFYLLSQLFLSYLSPLFKASLAKVKDLFKIVAEDLSSKLKYVFLELLASPSSSL